MGAPIYNRTWVEAWLKRINQQNEMVLFIMSIDTEDHISINTVPDLPQEKLAVMLNQIAEAIKDKQKTLLLPFNKEGLQS